MTRLLQIGPVASACVLLAACGQLLGLGKYDEVPAGAAGKSASGGTGGHAGAGGSGTGGHAGTGVTAGGGAGKPSGGTGGGGAIGGGAGESPAGAAGTEEAGRGGSSPETAGGGGMGAGGCSQTIEIATHGAPSLDNEIDPTADISYFSYEYNVDPQLDTAASDYFWLDFYTGGEYDGGNTGVFALGTGDDANYASCSRCIWLGVDLGDSGTAKTYFYAKSGRLDIASDSDQLNGYPDMHLTDVLLSEVTLDSDTHVSTEVPGGRCLHLATAALVIPKVAVPSGWKCPEYAYGTGDGCDCGCGAADPDCVAAQVGACDYCDDEGSCGVSDCSNITLIDNAKCTTADQGWTCDPLAYGDGTACDCGCGVVDYDCPGAESLYCNLCNDPKSCTASHTGTCADIDTTDNSKCL